MKADEIAIKNGQRYFPRFAQLFDFNQTKSRIGGRPVRLFEADNRQFSDYNITLETFIAITGCTVAPTLC